MRWNSIRRVETYKVYRHSHNVSRWLKGWLETFNSSLSADTVSREPQDETKDCREWKMIREKRGHSEWSIGNDRTASKIPKTLVSRQPTVWHTHFLKRVSSTLKNDLFRKCKLAVSPWLNKNKNLFLKKSLHFGASKLEKGTVSFRML